MLEYLFDLLPECLQKRIRPELDHLIADFHKLDANLTKLAKRHLAHLGDLKQAKKDIEANIAGMEHELERVGRVAGKIADLVR